MATSRFETICDRLRFSLDEPCVEQARGQRGIADFVARIRSSGLRVTATTLPNIHQTVCRVQQTLELGELPEVYVVNDPHANAAAPAFGRHSRPFVVLNSGLVNLLSSVELEFTLGHELGHLGMNHVFREGSAEPRTEFEALRARSRERYAEISADRIGLIAGRSVYSAAHVMVKLACGLTGSSVALDIDAFWDQLNRRPDEVNRDWELHESHPALPLRLWAVIRFAETSEYAQLSESMSSATNLTEIDREIERRFSELGDGRLTKMEDRVLQRSLTWLGLVLIAADALIEPHEQAALIDLVGEEDAEKAIGFFKEHGQDAVEQKLTETIGRIRDSNAATRRRFIEAVRSFCLALGLRLETSPAWVPLSTTLGPNFFLVGNQNEQ